MADADRLAQLDPLEQPGGHGHRAGAEAVEPPGVLVERDRRELLEVGRLDARREAEEEGAVDVPGAQRQVVRPRRDGGLAEVDERGDDGREQEPAPLPHRVRVGAQAGDGRRGGQQRVGRGRERDDHRRPVARPRLLELRPAMLQRALEQRPQPRRRRGRRRRAAEREQLLDQGSVQEDPARPGLSWTESGAARIPKGIRTYFRGFGW
jgi:hypothetical protein